ncbi:MAG: hypothetical protein ACJ77A_19090 [Actinomycetota bacterium]
MPRDRSNGPVPWENPVWILLIGLGGFLVGVGILLVGFWASDRSREFVGTIGFSVWAAVVGVQTAYWALVAGPLWADLATVWREDAPARRAVVTLTMALAVILLIPPVIALTAHSHRALSPLWGHTVKTMVLTVVGGSAVGLPALAGIAIVQHQVGRGARAAVDKDDVAAALRARARILRFLSVAGAVIGLAILAAGALRRASVPRYLSESEFPQEAVMLYGAFFTGVLLLVYAPAHLALRQFGTRIRDHYFPPEMMPAPSSDDLRGWLDKRSALEGLLQLDVTASQQLQASLFILAPLLSAVITTLAPKST